MTNSEFFTEIAKADVAQELKDFALEGIAKLDKKNASRSDKPQRRRLKMHLFLKRLWKFSRMKLLCSLLMLLLNLM